MSLAIVDAREWQNLLDLRTGKKAEDESPQTLMVRDILKRHPYPGDVDDRSNRWVTDTALDLVKAYQPQLACIFYAHQFFAGRYNPMTDDQRRKMIEDVFHEVRRLVEESGYTPVIVGSGDMVEVAGEIDLSKVDGIAISSHWSGRYAGLHKASRRDLDFVRSLDQIERVVRRDEWIGLFGGAAHRTGAHTGIPSGSPRRMDFCNHRDPDAQSFADTGCEFLDSCFHAVGSAGLHYGYSRADRAQSGQRQDRFDHPRRPGNSGLSIALPSLHQ